jgi:hypothetical protein
MGLMMPLVSRSRWVERETGQLAGCSVWLSF